MTQYILTLAREPKSTGGVRYENAELGGNGKPFAVYVPQALAREIGGGTYAQTIGMTLGAVEGAKIRRVR
jgi:hypothetical protein